jgi:hypothetical protein
VLDDEHEHVLRQITGGFFIFSAFPEELLQSALAGFDYCRQSLAVASSAESFHAFFIRHDPPQHP